MSLYYFALTDPSTQQAALQQQTSLVSASRGGIVLFMFMQHSSKSACVEAGLLDCRIFIAHQKYQKY